MSGYWLKEPAVENARPSRGRKYSAAPFRSHAENAFNLNLHDLVLLYNLEHECIRAQT